MSLCRKLKCDINQTRLIVIERQTREPAYLRTLCLGMFGGFEESRESVSKNVRFLLSLSTIFLSYQNVIGRKPTISKINLAKELKAVIVERFTFPQTPTSVARQCGEGKIHMGLYKCGWMLSGGAWFSRNTLFHSLFCSGKISHYN